jgi:hypothetical protein
MFKSINKNKRILYSFLYLLLLLTSCKKKILDIVPVVVIEDISIPGAKDIKYFSFPGSLIGYAASDTSFIYKTIDGGKSWNPVSLGLGSTDQCKGIEFFDEQNGMCLMDNSLYVTSDGGQNWTYSTSAKFMGITKKGTGIACSDAAYDRCNVYESTDKGQSFSFINDMYMSNYKSNSGRITENNAFVFEDNVFADDELYGMNCVTLAYVNIKFGNLTWDENPNDIYYYNGQSYVVGPTGLIAQNGSKSFFGHTYTFNSVDGYNDLVVAVGDQTIVSNLDTKSDEKWNDVLDVNGNGFRHTFFRVRFAAAHTFYVSGEKGLIWKATI